MEDLNIFSLILRFFYFYYVFYKYICGRLEEGGRFLKIGVISSCNFSIGVENLIVIEEV